MNPREVGLVACETMGERFAPLLVGLDISPIKEGKWSDIAALCGYRVDDYRFIRLAGRMIIDENARSCPATVEMYAKRAGHLLRDDVMADLHKNHEVYQRWIEEEKEVDLRHDWSSANALVRTYLLRERPKEPIETQKQMFLRLAVCAHAGDTKSCREVFSSLCQRKWSVASPIAFNAGKKGGQLSSCFVVSIGDNAKSILYEGVGDCGMVSKEGGGIGMDLSLVRHSEISCGGMAAGLVSWVCLYNAMIRVMDQKGKRKGAMTIFVRSHHVDIFPFCEVSLRTGDIYQRAHDVNTALWTSDLFWERVIHDGSWMLVCPALAPQLNDLYSEDFEKEYIAAEGDPNLRKEVVRARDLLKHIVRNQLLSSMPYILHGDAANRKSNQKNIGVIRSSNLCLEIMEHSSKDEIAVCNLSAISLHAFADSSTKTYDYDGLGKTTRTIVRFLDALIDVTNYPLERAKKGNLLHRPLGIGVSGFAETLAKLDLLIFDPEDESRPSAEARTLNKKIFACMYWNALAESVNLAREKGAYASFQGSPFSEGKLQFDLWKEEFDYLESLGRINPKVRSREDDVPVKPEEWGQRSIYGIKPTWESMKNAVAEGTRNSLLLACMPTASSVQSLRNTESVELPQENIYSRKVMNGAYPVVNRRMVKDLKAIGLWSSDVANLIQANNGSLSALPRFARTLHNFKEDQRLSYLVKKYRTMWEVKQKVFLQLAADRGRYIDQSQSTNIYLANPTEEQLTALHIYTYQLGLKTGMYYLRQKPARLPTATTIPARIMEFANNGQVETTCTRKKGCLSCSS